MPSSLEYLRGEALPKHRAAHTARKQLQEINALFGDE